MGGAASSVSTGAMAAATVTSSTVVAADGAAKAVSFLPTWRPGLIEVVLAGRVSDGLGLADIIFPSVLMAWAVKRDADNKSQKSEAIQYVFACACGYVLGCVTCELFPVLGQAALLCIVPSMLLSVVFTAWQRDEVGSLWGSES